MQQLVFNFTFFTNQISLISYILYTTYTFSYNNTNNILLHDCIKLIVSGLYNMQKKDNIIQESVNTLQGQVDSDNNTI